MRGDPLGSGVLRGEHARRALVAGRARGRRQLLVDRAADDRVHELQRRGVSARIRPARRASAASAACAVVEVRERGGVPDQRAVAHDRRRAGELLGGSREAGEPRADRRDDAVGRGAEHIARRARRRPRAARPRARAGRTGSRPSARGRCGTAASGPRGRRRARASADASSLSARGRNSAGAPPSASISATAAPPGSPSGRAATTSSTGTWLEPVPEVGEEPQRRGVGPMRIVDEQRQRPAAGEVGRQAVEAVQDGERSLRPERQEGRARPAGRRAAPPHGAPRPRRPRASPSWTAGSSSCRTTPNPNARSSSVPRAASGVSPASRASARAAATQRGLADPRRTLHDHRTPFTRRRPPRQPPGSRQAPRSARGARPARRASPADSAPSYGCVVDSVKVSVLL